VQDTFVDRYARARGEDQQRDDEAPEIDLAPVSQRMEFIGRPLGAVLGASFVIEGGSTYFAVREFRKSMSPGDSIWRALRSSKDPSIFVVLFENCAALVGLVIAAAFIGLTIVTGNPVWDGLGSVLIGLLLAGVAIVLAGECKHLLIGERARPELQQALHRISAGQRGVCVVNEVMTIHLSPSEVVAMLSLDLDDDLPVGEVERIAHRIEDAAKAEYPEVRRIFVRPQSRAAAGAEREALAAIVDY
jgi:Co/Zn/Cd efflux system component